VSERLGSQRDVGASLAAHLVARPPAGVVSVYLFGSQAAGRRLFCTDPEADHVYVRDVQLRAADLQPWLERMARIKLDALRR
jgi:hypothetical protein